MSFGWLDRFQRGTEKPENYADKTLAAYRLGIRAGGSIAGVRVVVDENCCEACRALPGDRVFHPDDAPLLPPADCERGRGCLCVYRPVMAYEIDGDG